MAIYPSWLNKKINLSSLRPLKELLREFKLHTVCEESLCPNISECFNKGRATFMILGACCMRGCRFCGIKKGSPLCPDTTEPQRVAAAAEKLNLRHVVITSPTRDDLADGGATFFLKTVKALKSLNRPVTVELLIPDFKGYKKAIQKVATSGADIVAHNLETVPSLYIKVRQAADYNRSLRVLKLLKETNKALITKSGLMLGLGETEKEVLEVFSDLRDGHCDYLTLGQYLAPSRSHYPVRKYVSPEKFKALGKEALQRGFKKVQSAPYVRSSYQASSPA